MKNPISNLCCWIKFNTIPLLFTAGCTLGAALIMLNHQASKIEKAENQAAIQEILETVREIRENQ